MKKLLVLIALILLIPGLVLAQSKLVSVSVAPTLTNYNVNYSAGDCVGGKLTFFATSGNPMPPGFVLQTVIVSDIGAAGKNLELLLFPSDPASGTFTDNSACDPTDTEIALATSVPIVQHFPYNDNGISVAQPGLILPTATGLFGVLVAKESTYQYASAAAVTVTLIMESR